MLEQRPGLGVQQEPSEAGLGLTERIQEGQRGPRQEWGLGLSRSALHPQEGHSRPTEATTQLQSSHASLAAGQCEAGTGLLRKVPRHV